MTEPSDDFSTKGVYGAYELRTARLSSGLRRLMPRPLRGLLTAICWRWFDARDFIAEWIGWLPSHPLRLLLHRRLLRVSIGHRTSIHRKGCFYRPSCMSIGSHSIINRDVLMDGRMGLQIGNHLSVSEGSAIITPECDANNPSFEARGAPVRISNRVFVGARAILLPGVVIGEGAVIAAGAVVTHNVEPFAIVAGVPAQPIGQRRQDLANTLDSRKFLG